MGGADFFQEFILTTVGKASLLYALEGSGGMLPWTILKFKSSNDAFCSLIWPKSGRFFVFGTLNWGGGGGEGRRLRPPSGSTIEQ